MAKQRGEIGMYLEGLLLERKMHQRDLAESADLSVGFMSDVFRGNRNLSGATIDLIAKALGRNKAERVAIQRRLNYLAATFAGYYIAEVLP